MGYNSKGETRNIHTIDGTLVKMPSNHRIAGAVIRVLSDPAGTEDIAVADF
jgi:hypothetical protein